MRPLPNRVILLPVFLFLGLMTVVTGLQAISSRPSADAAAKAAMEAGDTKAIALLAGPETDRTLARYARAVKLLESRNGDANPAEALRLLEANRHAPLVLAVSAHSSKDFLSDRSPASLVMVVGHGIARQARQEAEARNCEAALRWVAAGRALAAQLLATPGPTLDTVTTVRALDSITGLAEIEVYRRAGRDIDASRIARRERALKEYAQEVLLPGMSGAYRAFERSVRAFGGAVAENGVAPGRQSAPGALQMRAAQEADLAADMLALYRAKRGSLLRSNAAA